MDESELIARLALIREEHRALGDQIDALMFTADKMQLARMKKRKLLLKDEIARLQDQLVPDIIA